jgi:hypothetical protein
MNEKTVPAHIKILGWFISLSAFVLGFWHTHEGVRSFKALNGYGSFVVSGLILACLIVAYSRALSGLKIAFVFYLICALFNFTFNLNSFYPNLLGRKLLNEEANELQNVMVSNSNKLDSIYNKYGKGTNIMTDINQLEQLKSSIISEVIEQDGMGPNALSYLANFNRITNSNIDALNNIGNAEDRIKWLNRWTPKMDEAINTFVLTKYLQSDLSKLDIIRSKNAMDSLKYKFSPAFQHIARDNSKIPINDSIIENHPQIDTLKMFVIGIDTISSKVNKALGKNKSVLQVFNSDEAEKRNNYPKIQNLGQFDHTIESIGKRIKRTDTWGVLILVFFIDFIVPLAMFFMIRGGSSNNSSNRNQRTIVDYFTKRKQPKTF